MKPELVRLNSEKPPTVAQLAALSASMAKSWADDPGHLVLTAFEIWKASDKVLAEEREERKLRALLAAEQAQAPSEPPLRLRLPKKYPVTFDQFLRLVLPPKLTGRTAEQFALYREYLRTVEAVRRKETAKANGQDLNNLDAETFAPTKDEVDAMLAERRAKPFEDDLAYMKAGLLFQEWYLRRSKSQISQARRAAAFKSHGQPRRRKARPPRRKLKEALLT